MTCVNIPLFATLPVRDVRPFLHQRGDHPAQRQQGLVDASRLAGSLVHRTGTPDVLTAGEIHLEGEETRRLGAALFLLL